MAGILLTIVLLGSFSAFAQKAVQWGNLEPGSYAVGYQTIQMRDCTRDYINGCKPMQIYMWYPCVEEGRKSMTFQQYLEDAVRDFGDSNIFARDLKLKLPQEFRTGSLNPSFSTPLTDDAFHRIMSTPVPVIHNGQAVGTRHPLLLHMHANGALHQSLMMEYLASHGYVIMSLSMYNTAPAHYGHGEEGSNALLSQVEDLAFLISQARNIDFIDTTKIAMIGMLSQAGVALQMKESFLSAIACLDCQLNEKLLAQLPFYDPVKFSIPLLHAVNTQFQKQKNGFIDSLIYSPRYVYRFKNFPHSDFYPFPKVANPTLSATFRNYEFISAYTLHFLNSFLRDDQAARELLRNPKLESKYPSDYVTVHLQPEEERIMSESQFLTLLRFGDLEAVKKEWAHHPKIKDHLSKENFFSVVLFLCRDGDNHAFDALKMYTSTYPGEARNEMLFKLLGQSYLKTREDFAVQVFEYYHQNFPNSPDALEGTITALQQINDRPGTKAAAQKLVVLVNQLDLPDNEKQRLLSVATKVLKN